MKKTACDNCETIEPCNGKWISNLYTLIRDESRELYYGPQSAYALRYDSVGDFCSGQCLAEYMDKNASKLG